jgi:TRAP-type C4-dicarboxylate transport system substrate-binding protein
VLTVTMNKRRLASLSAAHQKALVEAAEQAGKEYMAAARTNIERDFARMQAQGAQYTVLDLKPGVDRMQPVIQQLEKEGFIPAGISERLRLAR